MQGCGHLSGSLRGGEERVSVIRSRLLSLEIARAAQRRPTTGDATSYVPKKKEYVWYPHISGPGGNSKLILGVLESLNTVSFTCYRRIVPFYQSRIILFRSLTVSLYPRPLDFVVPTVADTINSTSHHALTSRARARVHEQLSRLRLTRFWGVLPRWRIQPGCLPIGRQLSATLRRALCTCSQHSKESLSLTAPVKLHSLPRSRDVTGAKSCVTSRSKAVRPNAIHTSFSWTLRHAERVQKQAYVYATSSRTGRLARLRGYVITSGRVRSTRANRTPSLSSCSRMRCLQRRSCRHCC